MSESLDPQGSGCGCVAFPRRKMSTPRGAELDGNHRAPPPSPPGGGAGGGVGRRAGSGSRKPTAHAARPASTAATADGVAASLRDITLEEGSAAAGRGGADRSYATPYAAPYPPAPSAAALPSASSGASTPRYKAGGGGVSSAGSGSAASLPVEWRQAHDAANTALLAEATRATVEWSLKRRWEVPCAPDPAADVRAAVERRVPDSDATFKPPSATGARDSARWVSALRQLKGALALSAAVGAAAKECEAILLAGMAQVIDPNLRPLEAHLHAIAAEQLSLVAAALRAAPPMAGADADAAVHAKATAVHHVMSVALDDVQQQFVGGVADACAHKLEARLRDRAAAAALISEGVAIRRRAIETPWRLSALIAAVAAAAQPPPSSGAGGAHASGASSFFSPAAAANGRGRPDAHAGADGKGGVGLYSPPSLLDRRPGAAAARLLALLDSEPRAWLRELVLSADLDPADALPAQPPGLGPFVLTAIARYLDPHVDGDKQPLSAAELRALAQQGSLPLRLKAAWERGGGALAVAAALGAAPDRARPPPAFECRRELVLGVYVRHAVHKMNSTLGFGAHVPGVGRAPIGAVALQRHVKILAVSVLEAAQRDFNEGKPAVAVGSLVLSTELLEGLISEHLKAAFAAYDELNGALTLANKEGEDARKAERTRIWGHA